MVDIPITAFDRILRKAGCKRINLDAAEALREITEEIAVKIAKKTALITEHAGRKTTTRDDVHLAFRGLKLFIESDEL